MKTRPLLVFFGIAVVLGGIFVIGYLPRNLQTRKVVAASQRAVRELPEVQTIPVKLAPSDANLELSGTVQAVTETGLYARADGYVKNRIADIGDRVRRGDLLVELESPEVDQQLRQAQATLQQARSALRQAEAAREQARANAALAETTMSRWKELVEKGILSRQEGDEKSAVYEARQADVAAAEAQIEAAQNAVQAGEANVARLQEIQSFQKVRAPYDGVITQRNVVLGTLVSAGSSNALRELYRITQLDPLKMMVPVPQSFVPSIRVGLDCFIEVQELGNKPFRARVTRTANALDIASRTMLTEVQFSNPSGEVLPGMYAKVRFVTSRTTPPLVVPSDAIMTGSSGPTVVYLRGNNVAHIARVSLGRDDGASTEILSGLEPGDMVVLNPPDEVREGSRVHPLKLQVSQK
ncbi:MAG TPA: efflux RND transporter periplasmic adaptor subunit [Bryobacteraceae bacterium]|jgi:multidrug efflux pump subunit AcrA (membrane-fusion protein)|nr:efflux RND transporter periplasmic adaptor subunit [Bryobacteraceae bacterium]